MSIGSCSAFAQLCLLYFSLPQLVLLSLSALQSVLTDNNRPNNMQFEITGREAEAESRHHHHHRFSTALLNYCWAPNGQLIMVHNRCSTTEEIVFLFDSIHFFFLKMWCPQCNRTLGSAATVISFYRTNWLQLW